MINNANFDIAGKLFAYIAHHDSLTQEMVNQYNSSLIFIGDEQQIYVPIKNTYVGIGKSSYDSTVQSIVDLRNELTKLKVLSENQSVQMIYPQYGPYDKLSNNSSIVATTAYLTGGVEITSLGNYDASTGFAYTTYWYPLNGLGFKNSSVPWHSTNTPATSGIRISYEAEYTSVTYNGISYQKAGKQRLIIDDTQTWSYMTSAYSYSLNFSREYTNNQIETLYHDILGEPQRILVPVNDEDLYAITATGEKEWVNHEPLYYTWITEVPTYIVPGTNGGPSSTYWVTYSNQNQAENDHSIDHWNDATQINPNRTLADPHPQFYVISTTYDSTYNTNIANGIQTLKEVAYILDQLSDGSLGSVTYLTRTQWQGLTFANQTGNTYTISNNQNTYHRVYTNGVPTSNATSYGYWINKANPENLGIQIAYSIAGNKADIDDLHDHILLNEQGRTSVRSVSVESSNMMTVSVFANNSFAQTDTQQTIANPNGAGRQTYNLGDSRFIIGLDLASIYVTKTPGNENSEGAIDGVYFRGLMQEADITKIAGTTLPANTYYDSTYQKITGAQGVPTLDKSLTYKYWYIGKSSSYEYVNSKFVDILSETDFAELKSANTPIFAQDATSGHFHVVNNPSWPGDSYTYWYRQNQGEEKSVVTHAIIDQSKNQIATTAWTIALLNDHSGDISNDLTNVYKRACDYTDSEIDKLDAQLSYMDFNPANAKDLPGAPSWNNNLVEGTTEYEEQYNKLRDYWNTYVQNTTYLYNSSTPAHPLTALGKYAYLSNKVRSQYISNIVEEDGIIVSAGTTELPTDELSVTTSIWGNQDADFAKQYSKILFNNTSQNTAALKIKHLLSYSQVYFQNGDTTYEKVPNGTQISTSSGTYCYIDNGEFKSADVFTKAHFNMGKTNSAYWKQLYKQVSAYYEIDLDTITIDGSDVHFMYNLYADVNDPTKPSQWNATTSTLPNFYAVENIGSTNYSTKYISGEVVHYSYTKDGGFGQNRFNLTTHITHLEDATPKNTGLADAWDVASFIANMCEWVDLSKVFQ